MCNKENRLRTSMLLWDSCGCGASLGRGGACLAVYDSELTMIIMKYLVGWSYSYLYTKARIRFVTLMKGFTIT